MQQTVGLRCLKHRYMCEDERAMSRTSYHCTTSIREARPVIPLRVMATTHDLPNSLSSRTASQNLSSTDRCRRSNTRRVGTTNATPVLLDERRPTEAIPEPIQNNYSNQRLPYPAFPFSDTCSDWTWNSTRPVLCLHFAILWHVLGSDMLCRRLAMLDNIACQKLWLFVVWLVNTL